MTREVQAALAGAPPRLPTKYLYDRRGSELFDAICELPEYYPTRTELAIMKRAARQMAQRIGPEACLVELGSGSSIKTRQLVAALDRPAAYIPVDISRDHLMHSAGGLSRRFPELEVTPLCADFLQPLWLPSSERIRASRRKVVYFPGSTIGNLEPPEADTLLRSLARMTGQGGGLLIGIDLQKDTATIERAYDDAAGVTAMFNLNLLHHINRRLGCQIPAQAFRHAAVYDQTHHRIEMRLVAERPVEFPIGSRRYRFAAGEWIVTEYSHKYDPTDFATRAARTGWSTVSTWTDPDRRFAVLYAEARLRLKSKIPMTDDE